MFYLVTAIIILNKLFLNLFLSLLRERERDLLKLPFRTNLSPKLFVWFLITLFFLLLLFWCDKRFSVSTAVLVKVVLDYP